MVEQVQFNDRERQRLMDQYAEIATLAGGLAHEIKNPLSTISLNLEILSEDLEAEDSPGNRRRLQKIKTVQRECRHLEEILNAFLQFARVGEIEFEQADLNTLVGEFITFYQPRAAEAGIEISPHLDADLPPVLIDRSLIRQVLMNLALNAEQAMPAGGLLEIQSRRQGQSVLLEIIDTGVGMNSAAREKMFQVFYSTRPDGSGLGLPTVRKIVEAHHGTIACDSEPGQGTRFKIELPISS
jgi:signal transduction histidine kinase